MHPTITHQIALLNQRRMLEQADADRLARLATAGRPSTVARLLAALRRTAHGPAHRQQPRPTTRPAGTGRI